MAAGYGAAIGASTQGTTGFLTILEGKLDKRKAMKAEKALGNRPVYSIPEPTLKNQFMAENLAQQGLSDESQMMYSQRADRGLSESMDALLKVGGGINSVSDLYSAYQDKNVELASLNDQIKFRNQQVLANQNSQMADELDKQWSLNIFDPWKDEKQQIAEMRALAENKVSAGRSMVAQSGATMAGGGGDMGGGNSGGGQKQQRKTYQTNNQDAMMSERYNYQNTNYD